MQHDVVDAGRAEDSSGKSKQTLSECSGQPAGVERVSRLLQFVLNTSCERVCAAEHALRDPFRVLEGRHGLAELSERGAGVFANRPRVVPPHPEREIITLAENASRHGDRFAQQ